MFVVSVLDNGEQRTFVSEGLKILDRVVYATIRGQVQQFSLSEVLDVVPVEPKRAAAGGNALLGWHRLEAH